jgi:hypothetical protein
MLKKYRKQASHLHLGPTNGIGCPRHAVVGNIACCSVNKEIEGKSLRMIVIVVVVTTTTTITTTTTTTTTTTISPASALNAAGTCTCSNCYKNTVREEGGRTVTRLTAAASCDCKSTKFLANALMSSDELELYLPKREG